MVILVRVSDGATTAPRLCGKAMAITAVCSFTTTLRPLRSTVWTTSRRYPTWVVPIYTARHCSREAGGCAGLRTATLWAAAVETRIVIANVEQRNRQRGMESP